MRKFNKFVCLSAFIVLFSALSGCGGADERKSAYMERGLVLAAEGNHEKAKLEFKNALQIDPKDADAHYQLGLTLEKLGEWRPAMSQFLAVLKIDEMHTEAHIHTGQIYLLAGNLDKGLEDAEAALANQPENPDALVLRGGIRAKSGDLSGGFSDGLAALKIDPAHVNATALVSSLHLAQKDVTKAMILLEEGLKKNPTNTNLMTLKAKVFMAQKDADSTGKVLEEIITADPDNMVHRYQLTSFYISQKHLDKAEKTLRDAVVYEKGQEEKYSNKATLILIEFLAKYRGFEDAEKELLTSIEQNPEDSDLQFGLSNLYKAKDINKSIEVLQTIVDQNPYGAPEGLKAKSLIAVINMQQKNVDEAGKLAEEVLQENPKDVNSLTVRGSIALLKNDPDKAIADFRAILNGDPASTKHLRLLAHAHNANGEIELAREALEKAVESLPQENPSLRSELAEVLLKLGKPELAIEQIEMVLAVAPDNAAALETLFKLQSAKQDWSAALSTAEKIKEALPESGQGDHLSGLAQQMQSDFSSSIDDYTAALEKSPNAIQPLAQLVRGYMAEDKADEALARVDGVLKANPKNHVAMSMKGEILLAQNKLVEAREVLNNTIKIKPDYRTPYVALARTYVAENNIDEMIKVYESGVKVLPNDPVLITGLAGIYERAGKLDNAVTLYEKILENEPENILVANNLAMLYVDKIETPEAVDKAKTLLKVLEDTKNPAFMDTIGWVYYKTGNYSKAIILLDDVVRQAPQEPILQYHLGMAYFKDGKSTTLAKNHLQLAVSNGRDFSGKDEAQAALKELE